MTTITRTRTPPQDARREHLIALLGVQFPPDSDDGMTAQDWQQAHDAAAERAQRTDDAALYGTDRPDSLGVGY